VWEVSAGEVNKAYRKLSLLVHPDKAPGPEARQAFEQLKHAYNELKDADQLVRRCMVHARSVLVLCRCCSCTHCWCLQMLQTLLIDDATAAAWATERTYS
jgi:hypothetical protein